MRCSFLALLFAMCIACVNAFAADFTNYVNTDNTTQLADVGSHLWATTPTAVFRVDKASGVYEVFTAKDQFFGKPVCMLAISNSDVWVGTENNGAFHYDGRQWTNLTPILGAAPLPLITTIVRANDGAVWLGCHTRLNAQTKNALVRYEQQTAVVVGPADTAAGSVIRCILPLKNGIAFAVRNILQGNIVGIWESGTTKLFTASDGLPPVVPNQLSYPQLALDSAGAIWFCDGASGISRYADKVWTYMPVGGNNGPVYPAQYIDVDAQGLLWAAGSGGVCLFDGKAWSPSTNSAIFPLFKSAPVADLAIDKSGRVYVALGNTVLVRGTDKRWKKTEQDTLPGIPQVLTPSGNGMSVGTNKGMALYDGSWKIDNRTNEPAGGRVARVQAKSTNNFWALYNTADSVHGVGFYNGTWQHYGLEHGVEGGIQSALVVDGNGRVWTGTRGGLNVFDNGKWSFIPVLEDSLKYSNIAWLDYDQQGTIWTVAQTATQANPTPKPTLLRYSGSQWNSSALLAADDTVRNVLALARGTGGGLWLLTSPKSVDSTAKTCVGGLYSYRNSTWSRHDLAFQYANLNVPNSISGSAASGNDTLWVSFKGVIKTIMATDTIVSGNDTSFISYASFRGFPGGLSCYSNGVWKHMYLGSDIPVVGSYVGATSVSCIRVAPDGSIWLGSDGKGLFHFDGQEWTQYVPADGLVSDMINDIAFGDDGSVLVATDQGVSRLADGFVVAVRETADMPALRMQVAPNPVLASGEKFRVSLVAGATNDVAVRLLDIAGREVAVLHRGAIEAGEELQLHVAMPSLANGAYIIVAEVGAQKITKNIIVQR